MSAKVIPLIPKVDTLTESVIAKPGFAAKLLKVLWERHPDIFLSASSEAGEPLFITHKNFEAVFDHSGCVKAVRLIFRELRMRLCRECERGKSKSKGSNQTSSREVSEHLSDLRVS